MTCGFSPLPVTCSKPFTGNSVSLRECQCQGITQAGSNFRSNTDGPLAGSPCCGAAVRQSGVPGMGPNLALALCNTAGLSSASCAKTQNTKRHAAATATIVRCIASSVEPAPDKVRANAKGCQRQRSKQRIAEGRNTIDSKSVKQT